MEFNAAATQITPYASRGAVGARPAQGLFAIAGGRSTLPPMWFGVAAMLAFLTLLLSFNHVVRQGVQDAELRRQNAAAQSAAVWRCQALRHRQDRDDCLATIPGSAVRPMTTAYASF